MTLKLVKVEYWLSKIDFQVGNNFMSNLGELRLTSFLSFAVP